MCEVCTYNLHHLYIITHMHLMRKDFHERPSPAPERQVLLCPIIIRTNGHFWCPIIIRTFLILIPT